ncbi:ZDH24-like protein [Mya arenaria]|uniref:Palmitoyltransferase n=1 Tax=Mya arenaria TaxID=6604 RepID=A0ABY7FBD0_MYAAR|nr:probable palmitoyltransferase ZDHHC24 [Mya arenaria]WAR18327.1 ZDH24-like protein [Mya arenaria]
MEIRERKQHEESFKEKLKEKWQNRRELTPKKEEASQVAVAFFFVMFFLSLLETVFVLLPTIYGGWERWIMIGVTLWMFYTTLVNWHRSYFDTANYVKPEAKEKYFPDTKETPQDWKHCFTCQVDTPPRSFHCSYCGKCMLKRVHHCFITSSCIGFHNQKYFIMFLVWSLASLGYVIYHQLMYLNKTLPVDSAGFILYIPPVTIHQLIMGYLSFGQAFLVTHVFVAIGAFITSFFFFMWHLLLAVEGATNYEAKVRKFPYKGSINANLKSIFGSVLYIPLFLIFPFKLEQQGDGIQWKLRRTHAKGR